MSRTGREDEPADGAAEFDKKRRLEAVFAENANQPAINAPGIVLFLCGALLLVHLALQFAPDELANQVILSAAFIPARYLPLPELGGMLLPGGEVARVTSFITYAFLHGNWPHVLLNSFFMLAFGSVAAKRLGTGRFLFLSGLAAAIAASFSLFAGWGSGMILVGASGAIAGQVAVAIRLIFAHGGTLMSSMRKDLSFVRRDSLANLFRNRSAVVFIAVWMGVDILNASSGLLSDGRIAWEAHLGVF